MDAVAAIARELEQRGERTPGVPAVPVYIRKLRDEIRRMSSAVIRRRLGTSREAVPRTTLVLASLAKGKARAGVILPLVGNLQRAG